MKKKYTEKYWLKNPFWNKTWFIYEKIHVVQIEIRLLGGSLYFYRKSASHGGGMK